MLEAAVLLVIVSVVREAQSSETVDLDLGYELNENSARWVTAEPFTLTTFHNGYTEDGIWYESYSFCTAEHLGTHLDAPSHFAYKKWSVSDIPLEHLIGQGVVVDMRKKVEEDPSAQLTADDLMAWMNEHGPLPDRAIVFVLTGWGSRYGNKTAYFGTSTNDTTKLVFPGINPSAAQLLTRYEQAEGRRVFGVGIDTASLDHGPSILFETHVELSEANIYGLENVANLEKLPMKGFEVIVMPIKITGGSGGQCRILARIPAGDSSAASPFSLPVCHYFLILLIAVSLGLF